MALIATSFMSVKALAKALKWGAAMLENGQFLE